MLSCLILSCSLNPNSKSAVLADKLGELLEKRQVQVDLVDLRKHSLPLCDGNTAYSDERVVAIHSRIQAAMGIIVAAPVYNYDLNAAAKNVLELTGSAWAEKVVGFAVAAGGDSSYMSPLGFANSLMVDFRCLIIPRYVYGKGSQIQNGQIIDPEIDQRLIQLADEMQKQLMWRSSQSSS